MKERYIDNGGIRAGTLLAGLIAIDLALMIVAVALGVHAGDPLDHLAEKKFISWISVIQLLIVSWAAYGAYTARCPGTRRFNWRDPHAIWAIIAFGFFFLAADELTMIHESIDNGIHYLFSIQETAVTDRIDDIIIGVYGLIGLGALYYYRDEILKSRRLLRYLATGFTLLFTTVALDVLTNRDDIIASMVPQYAIETCHIWLSIVEESLEMIAESIFFTGFLVTRDSFRAAIAQKAGVYSVSFATDNHELAKPVAVSARHHSAPPSSRGALDKHARITTERSSHKR